jgi:amidase
VPAEFFDAEIWDLSMWSWDSFLAAIGQSGLDALAKVDGNQIFPAPDGALPDRYGSFDISLVEYVERAQSDGISDPFTGPNANLFRAGLEALETTRKLDLEEWLAAGGFTAAIFPTLTDVAPADADTNEASADIAWRNGVWVATGNLAMRHLGIPTLTIPMGTASDIGMPFGATLAGAAYSDATLLEIACALAALGERRTAPQLTPEI